MGKVRLALPSDIATLIGRIDAFMRSRGITAYATGGFLRDALLGVRPQDVDISVDRDPLTVGSQLADEIGGTYFALDEERRYARILPDGLEVHVDLLPLRGSIEDDLRLRDYTVDAMAASLSEAALGEADVIDPSGGGEDLRAGVVRCVAEQALIDDPLRLLRGPRISIERRFEIAPQTLDLIEKHRQLVSSAAAERQRDEIIRMMRTDRAGAAFRLLDRTGLLLVVMPEAEIMRGVEQPKEHYWDVMGHAFACVDMLDALLDESEPEAADAGELWRTLWGELNWWAGARDYLDEEIVRGSPRRAIIKLCGFLHDIGKPETKTFDENGRMRFFGHSEAGAEIASQLMERLRFSSREVTFVQRMIDAHLRPVQMAQSESGRPTDRAIFRFFKATGAAGIATLFLSVADHLATVGPRRNMEAVRLHARLTAYVIHKRFAEERVVSPPKLVRGDELMEALGIPPGPEVGRLLAVIEEAQAAGEVSTRDEALALARGSLKR